MKTILLLVAMCGSVSAQDLYVRTWVRPIIILNWNNGTYTTGLVTRSRRPFRRGWSPAYYRFTPQPRRYQNAMPHHSRY